jgi:hypothetical protein
MAEHSRGHCVRQAIRPSICLIERRSAELWNIYACIPASHEPPEPAMEHCRWQQYGLRVVPATFAASGWFGSLRSTHQLSLPLKCELRRQGVWSARKVRRRTSQDAHPLGSSNCLPKLFPTKIEQEHGVDVSPPGHRGGTDACPAILRLRDHWFHPRDLAATAVMNRNAGGEQERLPLLSHVMREPHHRRRASRCQLVRHEFLGSLIPSTKGSAVTP